MRPPPNLPPVAPALIVLGMATAVFGAIPLSKSLRPLPRAWEPPALERFSGRLIRAEAKTSPHNWKEYEFEIQIGSDPPKTYRPGDPVAGAEELKNMKPGDRVEAGAVGTILAELVWNGKYIVDEERRRVARNASNAIEAAAWRDGKRREGAILVLAGFSLVMVGIVWLVRATKKAGAMQRRRAETP